MTAHTTEPLAYREADEEEQYMRGCDFVIEQRDFTDNCKQIVAYCDDEHDASRIVACVNACAGKTNEQLEGAAGKLFTGSAIALWSNYCDLKEKNAALSEQVAGLVANLKKYGRHTKYCLYMDAFGLDSCNCGYAEAIAKAGSHE